MRALAVLCLVLACGGPTEPPQPLLCVVLAQQGTVTVYGSPIPGVPCVIPKKT